MCARALSLVTRSRTPVPMQHGTASHNRWKGNGERERKRERGTRTYTAGGEDTCDRDKEKNRGRERERGRPPLDPESANSNITIRPPRPKRRRTSRLPPSSYVFSTLSVSSLCCRLFTPPTSFSRFYLSHAAAPKLPFLPRPCFFYVSSSLFPPSRHAAAQHLRCTSALTSAKLEAPGARKRRRQTRFHSAPMKWRTRERFPL